MKFPGFGKFAEETTVHGVADWHRAGVLEKVVWTVAIICCLSFFGFAISGLVAEYTAKRPIASITEVDFEVPDFALRPSRWMYRDWVDPIRSTGGKSSDGKTIYSEHVNVTGASLDELRVLNDILNLWKSKTMHNLGNQEKSVSAANITRLLNMVTKPAKEVFVGTAQFRRVENAFPEGFSYYEFKSGAPFQAGVDSLTLYPERGVLCRDPTSGSLWSLLSGGLAVQRYSRSLLDIECNTHKTVTLTVKKYKRDINFCNPGLSEYKLPCEETCLARKAKETGCGDYIHSSVVDGVVAQCVEDKNEHTYSVMKDRRRHCREECANCTICRIPCEETYIAVGPVTSRASWTGRLNIFFSSTDRMVVTEISMKVTPLDLISSIGGTLGLCIGASLLSLSHIVYSMCSSIIYRRRKATIDLADGSWGV